MTKLRIAAIIWVLSFSSAWAGQLPFAGSYYQGDGTGVNWTLEIGAEGCFEFRWNGCLGTYDEQRGTWRLTDGEIVLTTSWKQVDGMSPSLPPRLVPVSLGARLYLVDAAEPQELCNAMNDGSEPRESAWGSVFLREDDWRLPPGGLPVFQNGFRCHLLSDPLRGAVVELLPYRRVRINIGAALGLQVGMMLYQQGREFVKYRVLAVFPEDAVAEPAYSTDASVLGAVSTLFWDPALRANGDE